MNKTNYLRFAYLALLACAMPLTGCNDSTSERNATVQGTLTIDGELASSGTVTFHPVDGGPVAIGQVQTDGSYSLSTGRGTADGPNSGTVFPGTYQATVMVTGAQDETIVVGEGGPPAAGPRLVAKKFMDKETSGLEFEIKSGRNLFVLPVLGASHNPPLEEVAAEDLATESDQETATKEAEEETKEGEVEEEVTAEEETTDEQQESESPEEETTEASNDNGSEASP